MLVFVLRRQQEPGFACSEPLFRLPSSIQFRDVFQVLRQALLHQPVWQQNDAVARSRKTPSVKTLTVDRCGGIRTTVISTPAAPSGAEEPGPLIVCQLDIASVQRQILSLRQLARLFGFCFEVACLCLVPEYSVEKPL